MDIKTKFNIGQEVYLIDHCSIIRVTVKKIQTQTQNRSQRDGNEEIDTHVLYEVITADNRNGCKHESTANEWNLYENKEDIIANID